MARESTIGLTFELELSKKTALVLETPGITKGATTVLNVSNTDPGWAGGWLVAGQLIYLSATGVADLDGKLHMISASSVGSETVTLSTDSSGMSGTVAAFGTINAQAINWQECPLSEFSPTPGQPGEIDVTTMSDTERKNVPGLSSPGTASFGGMFDLEDDGMVALDAAYKDATDRYFVGRTRSGQVAVFHGVVSAFSIGQLSVEAAMPFTGSFTLDESPYYFMEP